MNQLKLLRFPELHYSCRESIHTLCTNITFAGSEMRKIMLTSSMAHEGKSFLSLCTLRTLAQLGRKVVLIDADLRKSQIASRYGMKVVSGSGKGVTHFLAGMCPLEEVIYETDVPNAHIIPVGHKVSNSLSLLNSPRFAQMLSRLEQEYDYVLLDTPPVGVIIDAAEIAKFCDGCVFVIKENTISRKAVAEAKSQIEVSGCEILGAVLNSVSFGSLSSKKYYNKYYYKRYGYYGGYYGGYGYGYGYGPDEHEETSKRSSGDRKKKKKPTRAQ